MDTSIDGHTHRAGLALAFLFGSLMGGVTGYSSAKATTSERPVIRYGKPPPEPVCRLENNKGHCASDGDFTVLHVLPTDFYYCGYTPSGVVAIARDLGCPGEPTLGVWYAP